MLMKRKEENRKKRKFRDIDIINDNDVNIHELIQKMKKAAEVSMTVLIMLILFVVDSFNCVLTV